MRRFSRRSRASVFEPNSPCGSAHHGIARGLKWRPSAERAAMCEIGRRREVSISSVTTSVFAVIQIEPWEARDPLQPENAPSSILSDEVGGSFDPAQRTSHPIASPPIHLAAGTAAPQKPTFYHATSCGAGVSPAWRGGSHAIWWVSAATGVTVLGMTEDGARSR